MTQLSFIVGKKLWNMEEKMWSFDELQIEVANEFLIM